MITLPPPPAFQIGPIPRGYQVIPAHLNQGILVLPHDRYWSNTLQCWTVSNFVGKPIPSQHRLAPDIYIRRKQDMKVPVNSVNINEP